VSSVVVSSKFQVVIPKEIRERFGFKPGDRLSWYETPNGALKLIKPLSFDEMGGILAGLDLPAFEREKDYDGGEFT
jgi:AbrB family looped-hinge helix DNA binding protein